MMVFYLQADFEDPEAGFNGPSFLISAKDGFGVIVFGGEQQPVQGGFSIGRCLLGGTDGPQGDRGRRIGA